MIKETIEVLAGGLMSALMLFFAMATIVTVVAVAENIIERNRDNKKVANLVIASVSLFCITVSFVIGVLLLAVY